MEVGSGPPAGSAVDPTVAALAANANVNQGFAEPVDLVVQIQRGGGPYLFRRGHDGRSASGIQQNRNHATMQHARIRIADQCFAVPESLRRGFILEQGNGQDQAPADELAAQ